MDTCPICREGFPEFREVKSLDSVRYFNCVLCGTFAANKELIERLSRLTLMQRRQLLLWLRDVERQDLDDTPHVTSELLETGIKRYKPLRVTEMAGALLKHCVSAAPMGELFATNDKQGLELCRVSFALGPDELGSLVEYLSASGYVFVFRNEINFRVTARGVNYVEEGGVPPSDSHQAFIAMWFEPSMEAAYVEGFSAAIEDSGYIPFRVDKKEHANKIDDEIIAEIRRSRFVVADFTDHRGGVYFEAGFAQGIGLPVIWCCRKSDMTKLHFDIRQYNCIDWENETELRRRLSARIIALIGQGRVQKSSNQ